MKWPQLYNRPLSDEENAILARLDCEPDPNMELERGKDITGKRFGRLIAIARHEKTRSYGWKWLCYCDCGGKKIAPVYRLSMGVIQSCGCLQKIATSKATTTHGMSGSRTYRSWEAMWRRCTNSQDKQYKNYGGRGINVCDRWNCFEDFFVDLGECPDGLTIERLDNNGNYEPSNCVWATYAKQNRNRRSNRLITINGETRPLVDWANIYNIRPTTVANRIYEGWDEIDAVVTPLQTR